MNINKASISDLEVVVDMKLKMFKEVGSISLLQEDAEKKIKKVYKNMYEDDKLCHFILYENDNPIAICGAVIKEDIPFCFFKTPYYGYIMDVYCIPEKRGNGYATKVVESSINWLKEKGVHNIKLKPSNKGKSMYEKMGFQDSGELEKYI